MVAALTALAAASALIPASASNIAGKLLEREKALRERRFVDLREFRDELAMAGLSVGDHAGSSTERKGKISLIDDGATWAFCFASYSKELQKFHPEDTEVLAQYLRHILRWQAGYTWRSVAAMDHYYRVKLNQQRLDVKLLSEEDRKVALDNLVPISQAKAATSTPPQRATNGTYRSSDGYTNSGFTSGYRRYDNGYNADRSGNRSGNGNSSNSSSSSYNSNGSSSSSNGGASNNSNSSSGNSGSGDGSLSSNSSKNTSGGGGKGGGSNRKVVQPCRAYNDGRCLYWENQGHCRFAHVCARCRSKDHVATECNVSGDDDATGEGVAGNR